MDLSLWGEREEVKQLAELSSSPCDMRSVWLLWEKGLQSFTLLQLNHPLKKNLNNTKIEQPMFTVALNVLTVAVITFSHSASHTGKV